MNGKRRVAATIKRFCLDNMACYGERKERGTRERELECVLGVSKRETERECSWENKYIRLLQKFKILCTGKSHITLVWLRGGEKRDKVCML